MCGCAVQVVHGRPCRHIVTYNEGLVDEDDFAYLYTKKYHAQAYTSAPYLGVVDRRVPTDLSPPADLLRAGKCTGALAFPGADGVRKLQVRWGHHLHPARRQQILVTPPRRLVIG